MANIEIKGAERIFQRFSAAERNFFSRELMSNIGHFIIARIQLRTQTGYSSAFRKFKPYSRPYKLFRERTGRRTDIVNLTYTGSMLSAMTFDVVGEDSVRLFFMNTQDEKGMSNPDKAYFIQEGLKKRRFFAISREDRVLILNMVQEYLDAILSARQF